MANTCAAADCDEPAPRDMLGIELDDRVYCSPSCARSGIVEAVPTVVTLLDYQYRASRSEFPFAPDDAPELAREVKDAIDARGAIDQIDDATPEFRPTFNKQ